MPRIEVSEVLGDWEGDTDTVVAAARHQGRVDIELQPVPGRPGICSGCQQQTHAVHGYQWRRVRDLPILDAATNLMLPRRRVACPRCGAKLEQLSWLAPYARVTRRLSENVARLCAVLPIKHVAQHYRLGWDAVKQIDKAWLQRSLGPGRPARGHAAGDGRVRTAYRASHYATVIADAERRYMTILPAPG